MGKPNIYIFGFFQIQLIEEAIGVLDDSKLIEFNKTCNEHIIYKNNTFNHLKRKKILCAR